MFKVALALFAVLALVVVASAQYYGYGSYGVVPSYGYASYPSYGYGGYGGYGRGYYGSSYPYSSYYYGK